MLKPSTSCSRSRIPPRLSRPPERGTLSVPLRPAPGPHVPEYHAGAGTVGAVGAAAVPKLPQVEQQRARRHDGLDRLLLGGHPPDPAVRAGDVAGGAVL